MDFVTRRTRLLYKWSMYLWKLVLMRYNALQILMSSFDMV